MPLLSDTGEVTALTVLFRKSPTAPDPLEKRMPDGSTVVRKKAMGGSQQVALYITNADPAVTVDLDDIEVYVSATQSWVSLLAAPVTIDADISIRRLIETYPTETHVRITMDGALFDHRIEFAPVTP